jgi:hypothetical protein
MGGLCRERVLYDEDCGVVGEDVCFNTSVCKWDPRVGCVEEEKEREEDEEKGKEEESAKSESVLSWWFFAFIGLFNRTDPLSFFFLNQIYCLIIFFFLKFSDVSCSVIAINFIDSKYVILAKEEEEDRIK